MKSHWLGGRKEGVLPASPIYVRIRSEEGEGSSEVKKEARGSSKLIERVATPDDEIREKQEWAPKRKQIIASFITSNHFFRGTEQALLKENQRNLFHRFVNGPGRDGRWARITQDGKKEAQARDERAS